MLLANIPYPIVLEISTLDFDGGWKKIAAEIDFSFREIKCLEFDRRPTESLLRIWGCQNATVWDLYKVLHKVGRYEEMKHLEQIIQEENKPLLHIPEGVHYLNYEQMNNLQSDKNDDFVDEINPNDLPRPSELVHGQYKNSSTNNINVSDSGNAACNQKYPPHCSGVNLNTFSSLQCGMSGLMVNMEEVTCSYSYEEIESATESFSHCIGRGTFGSVYYGILKSSKCAIKKLSKDLNGINKAINILKKNPLDEMKLLLRYRHDNIINIYGYCFHKDDIYFVYEFMDKGSLQDCLLNDNDCLNWIERLTITKGIACGLYYLHSHSVPVIHGDIKSCNILINKHKEAKIGDLGLAGFLTDHSSELLDRVSKQVNPKLFGTIAYLPPEFCTSKGKRFLETDIYSFGVVLLEIITGKLAFDDRYAPKTLVEQMECSLEDKPRELWFKESDKRVECRSKTLIPNLFDIAFKCVSERRKDRPAMSEVVQNLNCLEKDFMRDIEVNVPEMLYESTSEYCQSNSSNRNDFDPFTSCEPFKLQRSWDERNKKKVEKISHSESVEDNCASDNVESLPDEELCSETCTSTHVESVSSEDEDTNSKTESDGMSSKEFSTSIKDERESFFKSYEAKKSNCFHENYNSSDKCGLNAE
ncbi:pelle-like serine/threonine-protein kinase pik-1 [Octopus bimaculoides]|nr:pelle-like serine/threonine-protein kinase pik-1 [Octopus bimaculoides]|eukprot:XP_014771936.1 PREDICTED: interleukin-1 receptor-associated kinase 4-like [Octopus bimaculoides]